MKFKTLQHGRALGPLEIFWRFAQDTLLTGAIYALLVLVTLALRYLASLMQSSELHYKVVIFLEHAIFLCGTLIVLLVLAYVTLITSIDLARSFRHAITVLPLETTPEGAQGKTSEL